MIAFSDSLGLVACVSNCGPAASPSIVLFGAFWSTLLGLLLFFSFVGQVFPSGGACQIDQPRGDGPIDESTRGDWPRLTVGQRTEAALSRSSVLDRLREKEGESVGAVECWAGPGPIGGRTRNAPCRGKQHWLAMDSSARVIGLPRRVAQHAEGGMEQPAMPLLAFPLPPGLPLRASRARMRASAVAHRPGGRFVVCRASAIHTDAFVLSHPLLPAQK